MKTWLKALFDRQFGEDAGQLLCKGYVIILSEVHTKNGWFFQPTAENLGLKLFTNKITHCHEILRIYIYMAIYTNFDIRKKANF